MNYSRNFSTIFIFVQILYLLHLSAVICPENEDKVKDRGPKLRNLPLVLMQMGNSEYSFPRCFRRGFIGESEIVDFTANSQSQQVYFCPKSAAVSYLDPTDGKKYYCEEPPEPEIRLIAINGCGERRDLYSYGYKLFETPIDEQNSSKTWKEIYSFCYDKEKKQMAYLSYRIRSPNLFENRQLERERSYYEFYYRLSKIEDQSLKAYLVTIMEYLDRSKKNSGFIQMELGHPADMIFPTWKKPFYHAVNQGLLIPELKSQWRKIGKHVRHLAQKRLGELDIITGTFPYPGDNGKLFGTWWKLVIYKNRAIAIILHNIFIERPKKEKKGKGKGKRTKKDENTDAKNESSIITNELIENKINSEIEPLKNDADSIGTPSKISTGVIKVEPTKNDPKAVVEAPEKGGNADGEPPKTDTDANGNPSTSDINVNGEYPKDFEKLCEDICSEMGFHGLASKELVVRAYCCDPKVITSQLGLQDYEILNLNRFRGKDELVINDGCPEDPIKELKSEVGKTSQSLNTGAQLQT